MDAVFEQALKEIEIDSYIELILNNGEFEEIEQCKLQRIDWDNRTLNLEVNNEQD